MHHADEVEVAFALGYFAKMLDKIHDICPVVHRILLSSAYEASAMYFKLGSSYKLVLVAQEYMSADPRPCLCT